MNFKTTGLEKIRILPIISALVIGSVLLLDVHEASPRSATFMPWQSIGGCGAGGSVTGGSSPMWIGRGVSGGLLDLEIRTTQSVIHANGGGTALLKAASVPILATLNNRVVDFYCFLPFVSKQRLSEAEDGSGKVDQAAGLGDITLGFLKNAGMEGAHSINLGLSLPTGTSDIHDFNHSLISSDIQNGTGVFGGNFTYDYSITRDWGLYILGATYSAGLFYLQSAQERWDNDLQRLVPQKRNFSVARTAGLSSKNNMGVINPDYLSMHAYGGITLPKATHSFGLNGSIPLANAAYHSYTYVITPRNNALISAYPDPGALLTEFGLPLPGDSLAYHFATSDSVWVVRQDVKVMENRWFTLTPSYGMEIQNDYAPVFLALSVPVEFNRKEGVGLKGFSLEAGIKFAAF